jgi:hypothetical protein
VTRPVLDPADQRPGLAELPQHASLNLVDIAGSPAKLGQFL